MCNFALQIKKTIEYGNYQTEQNSPPAPKGVERHLLVADQIHARHTDFGQRRTHQSRYERGTRLSQCFPLGKERGNHQERQCEHEVHPL